MEYKQLTKAETNDMKARWRPIRRKHEVGHIKILTEQSTQCMTWKFSLLHYLFHWKFDVATDDNFSTTLPDSTLKATALKPISKDIKGKHIFLHVVLGKQMFPRRDC